MSEKAVYKLKINMEFKNLIRPLQKKEFLQLEANILSDGCRDPIVTWKGFIVDGHNRYEICTEHQIPFEILEMDFECKEAAIAWIFGGNHNVTALTLPSDELAEQGYFTEISLSYMGKGDGADEKERKIYQWDDGVLFTIVDNRSAEEIYSLPVIKFDAMKWRTPLGAYYFSNCSAVWPQMGTWSSYNVEHEMIS